MCFGIQGRCLFNELNVIGQVADPIADSAGVWMR